MMERALPTNLEAERMVLGSVLLDESRMHGIREVLSDRDWSTEAHRRIWTTLCAMYDSGAAIDRVTIMDALDGRGWLESVGGVSYVADLDENLPRLPHIDSYVQLLRNAADRRMIMVAAQNLFQRAAQQMEAVPDLIECMRNLPNLLAGRDEKKQIELLEAIVARVGPEKILNPQRDERTISLPLPWLERSIGGLLPQQLVIIGGRTSQGKSSLAFQMAAHIASRGQRVVIFSLEMSKESVIRRMVSQSVRAGLAEDRAATTSTLEAMLDWTLFIDDSSSHTLAGIGSALRKFQAEHGAPALVIVDHLHLINGSAENRTQQVAQDARGLKMLAGEFNCPFVVPAQVGRAGARDNERPTLADLRQSGEIEENADIVLFVWLDLKENYTAATSDFQPAEVIIAKQREGVRGIACEMYFRRNCQRWEERDHDPGAH